MRSRLAHDIIQAPANLGRIATEVIDRIGAVAPDDWNRLVGEDDPFLEHAFLSALEESGSVGRRAGALPRFVLVRDGDRLVGALPLYLKMNSFGEFIFDWGWANGAQQAGIRYYPKLVAAVPFTPATGRRLLIAPDADAADVSARLVAGMRAVAEEEQASSIHVLFCTEGEADALAGQSFHKRLSMQFHWHNRSPAPYQSFDDFLGEMKSRHRKQLRHEREVAGSHGLSLRTLTGSEMDPATWRVLRDFYDANAEKHGARQYLTRAFFDVIQTTYAHRLVSTLAFRGSAPVAGTINFEKGRHIYGRYWGCLEELPMLHFELCYRRLIERAIDRGATRFEAGAQGEHKLKRGLVPAFTYSAHWIRHPQFDAAVGDYILREAAGVREEVLAYGAQSPFRAAGEPVEAAGGTR
jgi:predicted N-acyltransferase